jgi:hypothetical protein
MTGVKIFSQSKKQYSRSVKNITKTDYIIILKIGNDVFRNCLSKLQEDMN